jgi:hypothetical protein
VCACAYGCKGLKHKPLLVQFVWLIDSCIPGLGVWFVIAVDWSDEEQCVDIESLISQTSCLGCAMNTIYSYVWLWCTCICMHTYIHTSILVWCHVWLSMFGCMCVTVRCIQASPTYLCRQTYCTTCGRYVCVRVHAYITISCIVIAVLSHIHAHVDVLWSYHQCHGCTYLT